MSALFTSLPEEVVFWVVFLGPWVTLPAVLRRAGGYRLPDKRRGPKVRMMRLIPLFTLIFTFIIPILVGYLRIGELPHYLFYPGLAIWSAGSVVSIWGVLTLGRFHSPYVRVVSGHKVIQNGPYRFVRHPIYAGQIFGTIGLGLALQSWVALLIILTLAPVFYLYRIRIEERFLAAEVGGEYVQYMKKVKRIIPYIL